MKKVALVARILLGLAYLASGIVGLLNLVQPPPDIPAGAKAFSEAMMATGYFFPLIKGTEVVCGLLLITGFAAPLALLVLASITLNIVLFHLFLTPGAGNQMIPMVVVALHLVAATAYWHLYRPLFGRGR